MVGTADSFAHGLCVFSYKTYLWKNLDWCATPAQNPFDFFAKWRHEATQSYIIEIVDFMGKVGAHYHHDT